MTARLDDEAVIARLRLRGVRGDPVSARLRAARILDAASFRPPGLPPSAILVIRELRDPLPGMFPGSGSAIQPPPTWNRALASRIEMIARYARRPALEAVADNTAAVLFLDAGEMIACFARDWLRGTVFRRWWWERWKPNAATETALLDLWLTYPIDIPAVLDHLARSGDVVEFARRLSPAGIERVVGRVLETFALRELHVALSNSGGSTPGENPPGAADKTSAPPWERIAPDSTHSSLPPAAQVLIGVGLTLARAPLLARRSDYAESAQRWVRQKTAVPFAPAAPTAQQDSAQPIPTGAVESIPPAPDDDARAARTDARSERDTTAERRAEVQTNDAHTGDFTSPAAEQVGRRLPQEQTEASRENAALDSAEPLDGEAITTEYGGVFYLIDLALYLELYADITSPADSNIELPLWDFLALVGERLIGQELRDDPVWALLARLADHPETESPGAHFDLPDTWQIPPRWLRAFPEADTWRYGIAANRQIVDHPAGFRVLDVPDGGSTIEALTALYRDTVVFELLPGAVTPLASDGTERWLDWLTLYIEARLKRALGVDSVGTFLIPYRAQVWVTAARLDITLSLDALPVEIRLAGLDRDPGWIPAAGKFIRFHFE